MKWYNADNQFCFVRCINGVLDNEQIARAEELIVLAKETVAGYAHRYANEIVKKYKPHAIVLFGSYVNGSPHEYSDIDIAVVFNGFNGDWLAVSKDFWRISEGISLDIEPHLMDTTKDPSGFTEYVMRTGNVIYQA